MSNSPPEFSNIVIVGVGLLGASLALALKKITNPHITGVGRPGSNSLKIAQERAAIDHSTTDLASAVTNADLIVLCTPVRQFPEAIDILKGKLKPGAIVTDVGSTKAEVMKWAKSLGNGVFVGSHPMAGSEKRGPEFARPDLFENAMCLLCGDEGEPLNRIEAMWKSIGMKTMRLDAEEHDRWVGMVSHLPHAAAFALMNAAAKDPQMLEAAAGGFLDTTRVASSDVDMWTDIFLTNGKEVVGAMDSFLTEFEELREAIMRSDEKGIRAALLRAKASRDQLGLRRAREKGDRP